jgi:lipopolysaccharide/colanic/teichoic acid biosynthesis glycosyltransferase
MDCVYARQRNVVMDGMIIAATVPAVLMRRGSY